MASLFYIGSSVEFRSMPQITLTCILCTGNNKWLLMLSEGNFYSNKCSEYICQEVQSLYLKPEWDEGNRSIYIQWQKVTNTLGGN